MKKFISILLVAIAFVGCFSFFGCNEDTKPETPKTPEEEQKETTIITLTKQASVQFVLDQNNKVMSVFSESEEGSQILSQVNFVDMDAITATRTFTDYVTKLGYVPFKLNIIREDNFNSIAVEIGSALDEDKYSSLKASLKNSILSYFKENGIMCGARIIAREILEIANYTARYFYQSGIFIGSTNEEAFDAIKKLHKYEKTLTYAAFEKYKEEFELIRKDYDKELEENERSIKELQKTLVTKQQEFEIAKKLPASEENTNKTEQLYADIWGINEQIKQKTARINDILAELNPSFEAKKIEIEREYEGDFLRVEQETEAKLVTGKQTLEKQKQDFEQMTEEEKQEVLQKIDINQNTIDEFQREIDK